MFLTSPAVFARSLTKQIIPTFSYIKALFESSGTSLSFEKHCGLIFNCTLASKLIPNIETLRDAGVPDSNIVFMLEHFPRSVKVDSGKFRKVVEEVKQMNICPSKRKFAEAVIVIRSMTKSTWDAKVAAHKKWGWSKDDVDLAFQRNPWCMTISIDKITMCMDFLVNEIGLNSSVILKDPVIRNSSFRKRIKPRSSVYKVLVEEGLIEEGSLLNAIYHLPEDKFLKRLVYKYGTQVPDFLQLYHDNMDFSKS